MRNQIYNPPMPNKWIDLDKISHESQTYIGQIFLVTEDKLLANDINIYNESYCKPS